jgi:RNase_H superfamily
VANVLLLDLETSPLTAHVWGLRDQTIGLNQIRQQPRVIGVAAKWYGRNHVMWKSEYHHTRHDMLTWAHDLLDQADVVWHYNGTSFDIPWLHSEFAREDMPPPSPFKQVDLYRVARKHMRFPSYKLQYISTALGLSGKVQHEGHNLWVRCLENDDEKDRAKAWGQMRRYAKQDVALLEPLGDKLRPYFPASVNLAVFQPGDTPACQKCGSGDFLRAKGTAYTAQRAYPQYWCVPDKGGCGGWTRDSKASWAVSTTGVPR